MGMAMAGMSCSEGMQVWSLGLQWLVYLQTQRTQSGSGVAPGGAHGSINRSYLFTVTEACHFACSLLSDVCHADQTLLSIPGLTCPPGPNLLWPILNTTCFFHQPWAFDHCVWRRQMAAVLSPVARFQRWPAGT